MSASKDRVQASARVDPNLLDKLDQALLQARAEGRLPRNYSRSDALRDMMRMIAEDPSLLSDYSEDDP